jgi:signal transduction histidine kinase
MSQFRLRTKFLLSLLLIIAALTGGTLLVVQHTVEKHFHSQIQADLESSLTTFQQFQREREGELTHTAALLAGLPSLKAMMTTQDPLTIQDASQNIWQLADCSLLVLADRSGRVVALHTTAPGPDKAASQQFITKALQSGQTDAWWYSGGHLYEVFLQPVYFGAVENNAPLGVAALGFEINKQLAGEVAQITSTQVAFGHDGQIVAATLPASQTSALESIFAAPSPAAARDLHQLKLAGERFLASAVELPPQSSQPVILVLLKSYDEATRFVVTLNRLLIVLGLLAIIAGSLLVYLVSDTFTRPLASLVGSVHALERGDYDYPLETGGKDEAAELARAFDRMRRNLQGTQRQLIEAEQLATIGRMASSISHDLRHPLTAVLANAELLATQSMDPRQREELYQEIRSAVDHLTDLVDSLLELSRAREHLRLVTAPIQDVIERSAHSVVMDPFYSSVRISVNCTGSGIATFDPRRMERVFQNLLLNACQVVPRPGGEVRVDIRMLSDGLEIRVADNGPGIPPAIRGTLFQPFVSSGKENGTGLGLTVAQKVLQDHGGDIAVESSGTAQTVFRIFLPCNAPELQQETDASAFTRR